MWSSNRKATNTYLQCMLACFLNMATQLCKLMQRCTFLCGMTVFGLLTQVDPSLVDEAKENEAFFTKIVQLAN